jgi:hypothetical protein
MGVVTAIALFWSNKPNPATSCPCTSASLATTERAGPFGSSLGTAGAAAGLLLLKPGTWKAADAREHRPMKLGKLLRKNMRKPHFREREGVKIVPGALLGRTPVSTAPIEPGWCPRGAAMARPGLGAPGETPWPC